MDKCKDDCHDHKLNIIKQLLVCQHLKKLKCISIKLMPKVSMNVVSCGYNPGLQDIFFLHF